MRILQTFLTVFILITASVLNSGCSTPQPSPIVTPDNTGLRIESPQPQPTTAPGTGTVQGVVLNSATKSPLSEADGVVIFLTPVLRDAQNTVAVGQLDREHTPRATPDASGRFTVLNVPPGDYAVAVFTPVSVTTARKVEDLTKDFVITVQAEQTVNVGQIYGRYP